MQGAVQGQRNEVVHESNHVDERKDDLQIAPPYVHVADRPQLWKTRAWRRGGRGGPGD